MMSMAQTVQSFFQRDVYVDASGPAEKGGTPPAVPSTSDQSAPVPVADFPMEDQDMEYRPEGRDSPSISSSGSESDDEFGKGVMSEFDVRTANPPITSPRHVFRRPPSSGRSLVRRFNVRRRGRRVPLVVVPRLEQANVTPGTPPDQGSPSATESSAGNTRKRLDFVPTTTSTPAAKGTDQQEVQSGPPQPGRKEVPSAPPRVQLDTQEDEPCYQFNPSHCHNIVSVQKLTHQMKIRVQDQETGTISYILFPKDTTLYKPLNRQRFRNDHFKIRFNPRSCTILAQLIKEYNFCCVCNTRTLQKPDARFKHVRKFHRGT